MREVCVEGDVTDCCVHEKEGEGRSCEESMYDEEEGSYAGNHGYLETVDPSQPLIQSTPSTRKHRVNSAYDAVLARSGITWRVILVIVCSGVGLLSDTLEIMGISFAKDDISKQFMLSRQEESTLAGCLFAGMLIGGLFWGRAADVFGRRHVLMISLSMNGVCAALSALAPSFPTFLVARFFSGIGVGGSLPIIFSYTSEWVCKAVKGRVICAVATCWMFGSILAAGLAWAILPVEFAGNGEYWRPWRVYLLICSLPSLIAVFIYSTLPESPIFLINIGRKQKALEILRVNMGSCSEITEELRVLKRELDDSPCTLPEPTSPSAAVSSFFLGVARLFKPSLRRTTLVLIGVIFPVHFGYYGFMLWFPEYISRNSPAHETDRERVYRESLYVNLSSVPGNLLTILLTDKIGPKYILCSSLVLSAGSVFLLWGLDSPSLILGLSCLFNGVSAPAFNMVDVILPPLYPTELRSTAFGFHTALIRVGMLTSSWLFSLFIDTSPAVPILLTGIILIGSSLLAVLIPNVKASLH